MRRELFLVAALVAGLGCAGGADEGGAGAGRDLALQVEHDGRIFRAGDRVHLVSQAGVVSPRLSGHPHTLAMGPGQVGTVLGGEHLTTYDMPRDVVVVRWDAQTWYEWTPPYERLARGIVGDRAEPAGLDEYGAVVELSAFESSVHPSYLEVIVPP
jgi:hypothetical protein